jgi:endonuclease/exonuclease/phosphatase family metal-dependent hydrolase
MAIRVLTLNCWNVTEPFAPRMALVRAELARLRPDLLALQEIVIRRDGLDQAAMILDGLGYESAFGAAYRWDETGVLPSGAGRGDAFGNVVASRWPIRRHEVEPLPDGGTGEYRSAIGALVETPAGVVPFVSTHLNWRYDHGVVRERQVVALAAFVHRLARDVGFPPIVGGDLNAEPDSTEIRFLSGLASLEGRSVYFQDAWRVAHPRDPRVHVGQPRRLRGRGVGARPPDRLRVRRGGDARRPRPRRVGRAGVHHPRRKRLPERPLRRRRRRPDARPLEATPAWGRDRTG